MPRRNLVSLPLVAGLLLAPVPSRAAGAPATASTPALSPAPAMSPAPAASAPAKAPAPGKRPALAGLLSRLKTPKISTLTLSLPHSFWTTLGVTPRFVPGQWYEYRQSRPYAAPTMIRIGVIPSLRFKGPRDHLLEIRVTQPTGMKTWLKLVLSSGPGGTTVRKLMLEYATMPPIELPLDHPAKGDKVKVDPVKRAGTTKLSGMQFKHLGTEKITVPAGTFEARHLRVIDPHAKKGHRVQADLWLSAKVMPLFGLVKITAPGGQAIVLSATGTGAVTDLPPFARDKPKGKRGRQGMGSARVK